MDLTTFKNCLDRLGHLLEDWPGDQAAEARALLTESVEARAALDGAEALAKALAALPEQPASLPLRNRILTEVQAQAASSLPAAPTAATTPESLPPGSWPRFLDWFTGAIWRPALAAAATVAFGFALGLSLPVASEDEQLAAELGLFALSADYEEPGDEN